MVKISACMACKSWSKGWQDKVNPPYNKHYCASCWADFLGYGDVSSKDTVWLREAWKQDNRAVSHSASCARAEQHEARKAQGKEVTMHASVWNSTFPDGASSGAWHSQEARASGDSDPEGASWTAVREQEEDGVTGKMIVLLKPFCQMPAGTKATVIGTKATSSGRQRLLFGPAWGDGILSDKLGKLFLFCEAEDEEVEHAEEGERDTPAWVQRGIDVLWQHGGGNMKYANFANLVGPSTFDGAKKQDVFARPEFECCGKGNNSVRLAGWLRLQRYA